MVIILFLILKIGTQNWTPYLFSLFFLFFIVLSAGNAAGDPLLSPCEGEAIYRDLP